MSKRLTNGVTKRYKGWYLGEIKPLDGEYTWVHSEHGEFVGTISDLYYKYPEQNLDRSGLTKVTKGKVKKSKGWSIKK